MQSKEVKYFEKELTRAEAKLHEIYTLISRGVIRLYGRNGRRGLGYVQACELSDDDLELSKMTYIAEGLEREIFMLREMLELERKALEN